MLVFELFSQTPIRSVVNSYTNVTWVSSTNHIKIENSVDFSVGDTVLIIQIKGADIVVDQTAAFGDITAYNEAGNYEFAIIDSINYTTNEVVLSCNLQRNYDVNGIVQFVSVPNYHRAIVDSTLTAKRWDFTEEEGGVLAIIVRDTLFLNANISVEGKGLWGGNPVYDANSISACAADNSVYQNYYYGVASDDYAGYKGGGITNDNSLYLRGRGKLANGGGGGNTLDAAGGGGGNYGVGGRGGKEADFCSSPMEVGGEGGAALLYTNLENRIFLGGGGGSGTQEVSGGDASAGGYGGGIAIIIAENIVGNGYEIDANGESVVGIVAEESTGGGGAGGTVLLDVQNYIGELNISTQGGNGGSAQPGSISYCRGTGGGGGGGLIWHNGTSMPSNVNVTLSGGLAGNHIGSGCDAFIGDTGSDGGLLSELTIPYNCILFCAPENNYISAAQTICSGNLPDELTGTLPTGGTGSYSYQWQYSTDQVTWVDVPGISDLQDYQPPILNTTWYFRRIVDPGPCQSISNNITIEVVDAPVISAGSDTVVCSGDNIVLTGSIVYEPLCEEATTEVQVNLQTSSFAEEIYWWIEDESGVVVAGQYGPGLYSSTPQIYNYTFNLEPGDYYLFAYDTFGDTWHGGGITVIPQEGRSIMNFDPPYCVG